MKDPISKQPYKTLLKDYKIIKTIGEGTFGKVKLGIHIPTSIEVGIKILEGSKIIEKDDYERISREIIFLKQINHKNIIQIYEIIEYDNNFYIIMELASGGELYDYIINKKRLSVQEASLFFIQILDGLEYMHSLSIAHRDLKPENILLTEDKLIKIIDFGLSNSYLNSILNTPCGSPCYASPEMILGKEYNGEKSDIWSFGILLYAMVCGYLPYDSKDINEMYKNILGGKVSYPSHLLMSTKDIISKMLTVDPEMRPSIKEIKEHIFYKKGYDSLKESGNFFKTNTENEKDLKEYIIYYMVNYMKYDTKEIEYSLLNSLFNHITTTYKLLFSNKNKKSHSLVKEYFIENEKEKENIRQSIISQSSSGRKSNYLKRIPIVSSSCIGKKNDNMINISIQCNNNLNIENLNINISNSINNTENQETNRKKEIYSNPISSRRNIVHKENKIVNDNKNNHTIVEDFNLINKSNSYRNLNRKSCITNQSSQQNITKKKSKVANRNMSNSLKIINENESDCKTYNNTQTYKNNVFEKGVHRNCHVKYKSQDLNENIYENMKIINKKSDCKENNKFIINVDTNGLSLLLRKITKNKIKRKEGIEENTSRDNEKSRSNMISKKVKENLNKSVNEYVNNIYLKLKKELNEKTNLKENQVNKGIVSYKYIYPKQKGIKNIVNQKKNMSISSKDIYLYSINNKVNKIEKNTIKNEISHNTLNNSIKTQMEKIFNENFNENTRNEINKKLDNQSKGNKTNAKSSSFTNLNMYISNSKSKPNTSLSKSRFSPNVISKSCLSNSKSCMSNLSSSQISMSSLNQNQIKEKESKKKYLKKEVINLNMNINQNKIVEKGKSNVNSNSNISINNDYLNTITYPIKKKRNKEDECLSNNSLNYNKKGFFSILLHNLAEFKIRFSQFCKKNSISIIELKKNLIYKCVFISSSYIVNNVNNYFILQYHNDKHGILCQVIYSHDDEKLKRIIKKFMFEVIN